MNEQEKKQKTEHKNNFRISHHMLILVILLITLFSIVYVTRTLYFNNDLPGDLPYYNLRISKEYMFQGARDVDGLISPPRSLSLNVYQLLLAHTGNIFSYQEVYVFFSFFFAVISVILLNSILKTVNVRKTLRFLSLLILIISPLFINIFIVDGRLAFLLFLNILFIYLYIKETKLSLIFSLLVFSLIPLFGFIHIIFPALLVFAYSQRTKNSKYFYIFLTFAAFISMFSFFQSSPISTKLIESSYVISQSILAKYFHIFGGQGFSSFVIVLFCIGFFSSWTLRKDTLIMYSLSILMIILSFSLFDEVKGYLSLVVSVFAGLGFAKLIQMDWKLKLVKQLTILLIFCGLLFTLVSAMKQLNLSEPSPELIQGLVWLQQEKQNGISQGVVLSHYKNGIWINAISGKPVILDSFLENTPNVNERLNDTSVIFESRNLEKTKELLKKYEVRYIFIDADMKNSLVWSEDEEGLLFLFRNNETFKSIYSNNQVEIWEFLDNDI